MGKEPLFAKVDHVGIVVRDIDKATAYYESLGIGPFEAPPGGLIPISRKLRGKAIPLDSFKVKERNAQIGQIKVQLIQPWMGQSIWKEFLDTKGEGVQHLGFITDDIDKDEAALLAKGIQPLLSSRFQNGVGSAYFDTGAVGGILMEIVQWQAKK